MAQRVKALSSKTEDLSSSPGIHRVGGENCLPQVVSDCTQMVSCMHTTSCQADKCHFKIKVQNNKLGLER